MIPSRRPLGRLAACLLATVCFAACGGDDNDNAVVPATGSVPASDGTASEATHRHAGRSRCHRIERLCHAEHDGESCGCGIDHGAPHRCRTTRCQRDVREADGTTTTVKAAATATTTTAKPRRHHDHVEGDSHGSAHHRACAGDTGADHRRPGEAATEDGVGNGAPMAHRRPSRQTSVTSSRSRSRRPPSRSSTCTATTSPTVARRWVSNSRPTWPAASSSRATPTWCRGLHARHFLNRRTTCVLSNDRRPGREEGRRVSPPPFWLSWSSCASADALVATTVAPASTCTC